MNVIWFFAFLVSAFFWFAWAFGLISYSPWAVPCAFVILGIHMVIEAMRAL